MRTRSRRRAGALLVLAVLVTGIADIPIARRAAAQDQITDKRTEAERIARQLEQQSRQVSILAEQYDAAQVRIASLQEELDTAEAKVRQTDAEVTEIRTRLKEQAVESYIRGGNAPAIALLAQTHGVDDIAVRTQYVQTVTSTKTDLLDELRVVRQELELQQSKLDSAKAEARTAAELASSKRKEADAAVAAQKATLSKVQGELAALVEAEERRRAEEEARRVQAELAAKKARAEAAAREQAARDAAAAREAAARRTTTTTAAETRNASPSGTVRPTTTTAPRTTTTMSPPSTTGGGDSSGSSGAPAAGADAAIAEARRQLGKPYEYGGSGPDTFDCSGLTSWAWRAGGKRLSHSSQAQWSETSRVDIDDLQPGDLVFYGSPIHHVGLFIGDGQMIEAPETGKNVRIASIYRRDFVGAGRVN